MHYDQLKDKKAKAIIKKSTRAYKNKVDYFIEKLAEGVAMIGAAFYPKDVIVRMSDFKSNEYANLVGGSEFEPEEAIPCLDGAALPAIILENYRLSLWPGVHGHEKSKGRDGTNKHQAYDSILQDC